MVLNKFPRIKWHMKTSDETENHRNNLLLNKYIVNLVYHEVTAKWTGLENATSSHDRVKPKTIKLPFVASPLSTQLKGERAKTGWLGIGIIFPSGETCLSWNCWFSQSALKNPTNHVGLVQNGPHHHLIKN